MSYDGPAGAPLAVGPAALWRGSVAMYGAHVHDPGLRLLVPDPAGVRLLARLHLSPGGAGPAREPT